MHLNFRRVIPFAILLVVLAAAYWYFALRPTQKSNSALTASGTIEASQVQISPEGSGKITAVLVSEGEFVHTGALLVQLDTALLEAQRAQAEAAKNAALANQALLKAGATDEQIQIAQAQLDQAQASYNLAAGTLPAQQIASIASAKLALMQAQNALADLEDNAPLTAAQAQSSVATAQKVLDEAQRVRTNMNYARANQTTIDGAQAFYELKEEELKKAEQEYNNVRDLPADDPERNARLLKQSNAQKARDQALATLNWYLGKNEEQDLAEADAALALAKEQLAAAERQWAKWKDGPAAKDLALAKEKVIQAQALLDAANGQSAETQLDLLRAQVDAARANLINLKNATRPEQLEAAQAQVDAAQAALDILDVQISKLTIVSPVDGVVLTRLIQPGEIALPNATLLVLGLVDDMTITVYVPEDRYGEISVGQEATVSVDSFPDVSFKAVVTTIADQAEFTPRNVQTMEGRKTTVFAIRLQIVEPDDRLKPGMPADVIFK